ncbi:hypothetical protein C1H46_043510 [Malus baccata]|uniref:Uncharacterized protein n=1 Tax=Malus baccata TaxID=106549 RepID=A0A540KAI7_MALBA|nr:hypothetical protein C1H46_043510 [Malus baccata]
MERDSLKNVYHKIYSRFIFYRSFMRKYTNDVFLHYVFETERHCGIRELLEIWGSIINGFTVPLKEEHKLFLMRVLIPFHKAKGMQSYDAELPQAAGLLCVAVCAEGAHAWRDCGERNLEVAERVLYVWNNEHFVKMISVAMEEVFLVVVEGMEKNLKWLWSKSVRQLTENVKVMLEEMDPVLYSKCLEEIELRESKANQAEINRKEKWDRIEMAAAAKPQFLQPQHFLCVYK